MQEWRDRSINFRAIGIVHTPYEELAPFRPDEKAEGDFYLELFPEHQEALYLLERFNYFHVLFYIDRARAHKYRVHPPNAGGKAVGLFASRSPNRVNPIGLSTVRLLKIEKNKVFTSGLDILNNTPLLDIKPYIRDLDMKSDANFGWLDGE